MNLSPLVAGACLALAWPLSAGAQSPMASQAPLRYPPPPVSMTSNVIYAKDVPVVTMAEWEIVQKGQGEQTGARVLIAAGEAELQRAPAEAVRYGSQSFHFPSGQIRVLRFSRKAGGVLHQITTETQLYVAQGSAEVGVAGQPTEIFAGDVVNLPSGVLRSRPGKAEDTVVVLYTVRSPMPGARATLVRGKDVKAEAVTGDKAGRGGAKVSVKRYAFDGNSIRVASLRGKGQTGLSTHWDVLESSSFVATNAPFANAVPPFPTGAAPRNSGSTTSPPKETPR